jgi:hypothetical protein
MTRFTGVPAAGALLGLMVLAACGGATPDGAPGPSGPGSRGSVSVSPEAASLSPNGTATFTASAAGPAVSWSVLEGSPGGSITAAGVYTAPSAAGTYHVTASSGSVSATATVTVKLATATYDGVVLADRPVAFWSMSSTTGTEPDLAGNGHAGAYRGGQPPTVTMPNGDRAVDFNGSSEYLTVPSSPAFSIPTTGSLTWEAWIRPDTLQFPNDSADGYVDWMGKCESYSPTCEWEARLYDTSTAEGRPNRFSAYAFNPSAGLGSAADWQPVGSLIVAGHWYHVVGEYTTLSQPSGCASSSSYPGSLNIWVDGVLWSQSSHSPTGCMSQYSVRPVASGSALNIATMAMDTWFAGAIGKVAIYDHLLTQAQISAHYQTMTGRSPGGSCASTCTLTNP